MLDYSNKLILILGAIIVWSCNNSSSKNGAIIDFVPEDVSVVFKISEDPVSRGGFDTFKSDLKINTVLSTIAKSTRFSSHLENSAILKHFQPTSGSLLCMNILEDSVAAFTLITKNEPHLFLVDSLTKVLIDTINDRNTKIQRLTIDSQIVYTSIKDSVFIASSSQRLLKSILEGKTEKNVNFQKIYNIKNTGDFTAIIKGEPIVISDSLSVNFASWSGLDLTVLPDGLQASGVALAGDTIPQILTIFEGQVPQQNDISKVIPTKALGALAFTFNDAESFQNRIKDFRKDTIIKTSTELFGSINEVGVISLSDEEVIVLKSIDPSLTKESLARFITAEGSFREVSISSFSEKDLFNETFYPLINNVQPKFSFQLENFFVFTESKLGTEQIITAFQNNDCLHQASYYEIHQSQLSSASSLVFFKMHGTIPLGISGFLAANSNEKEDNIYLKNYPLTALQFSYDRNFAHVNYICTEASTRKKTVGTVSEVFSLKLPNEIIGDPQFFSNHRTGEKEVVFQDITNSVYLVSSKGKVLWKAKLDNPILGKINEVDLLRNGKKQLAFATKSTFYMLDRTGRLVTPFPIKFKDPITQPLSVFDYDTNRKYRFVITQGKEIYMYNAKGKIVKGFNFRKTKSNIVQPPKHIRLGNKDYIAIAEENGKLNLLSRVGKSRVNVSKNFKFSEIPVTKERNQFVVITTDNKKESISQNGKVSSRRLNVSDNYSFAIKGTTKATLDDNLLRINGKLVELPFGVYTRPQLYFANKTTYISITETQENKVYVYDSFRSLLPGFPVFGTSQAAIGNTSKKGKLIVVVKGDPKEILLYSMN